MTPDATSGRALDARPERAAYRPADLVRLILDAPAPGVADVDTVVARQHVELRLGRHVVELGMFTEGSCAGRSDLADVADSLRAFHVNVVQFYDWMYRHADLVPPADAYLDALDRPRSSTRCVTPCRRRR